MLRLRDDGSVPPDNPFVGKAGHKPEVYTLGHRSSLGLAVHPGTGEMWQNENGPNGGDEINILKPGAQLRLAARELGRTYPGPWQSEQFWREGFEPPVVYWMPSIAVSGMAFYTGDRCRSGRATCSSARCAPARFPAPAISSGSCSTRRWRSCAASRCSRELRQRIRDVRQGPDGLLYLLTDDKDGAVLRIEPAAGRTEAIRIYNSQFTSRHPFANCELSIVNFCVA